MGGGGLWRVVVEKYAHPLLVSPSIAACIPSKGWSYNSGGKQEEEEKKTDGNGNSGHYVIASSRPLERLTLVPIRILVLNLSNIQLLRNQCLNCLPPPQAAKELHSLSIFSGENRNIANDSNPSIIQSVLG